MSELLFYLVVAATIPLAFVHWRAALYAVIVFDILRDPIRKMSEGHSVWVTVSVIAVWGAIAAAVLIQERRTLTDMHRYHPQLRTAFVLLCLALVPGALLSVLNYPDGWKLAAVGGASYLAPVPGMIIGYVFVRTRADLGRFMAVYCIANCIALSGALLEYFKVDVPGLGGIQMAWIRHRPGYVVELISGFYRSPDILGLHAAMVIMFAIILASERKQDVRRRWYLVVLWAAVALLLSGRRKMIAMPFVFATVFSYFQFRYLPRLAYSRVFGLLALAGLVAVFLLIGGSPEDMGVAPEYTWYASTLFTEGVGRTEEILASSVNSTWDQQGMLGGGLGIATQGSYYVVRDRLTWQEDGAGRLFAELGVPGLILLGFAGVLVARRSYIALKMIPPNSPFYLLQCGLCAVLIANLACFLVSHQAYSGDPSSVTIVGFCLGVLLSLPQRLGGDGDSPRVTARVHRE